jgi:hypothetical protein
MDELRDELTVHKGPEVAQYFANLALFYTVFAFEHKLLGQHKIARDAHAKACMFARMVEVYA